MKKILLALGIVLVALILSVNVYAQEQAEEPGSDDGSSEVGYDNTPINKMGRGAINVATCWTEIPGTIAGVSKEHDPFLGITLGTVEGTVTTLVRGAAGLFDIVTGLFPPYDKPLMQPEYAYQEADNKIKLYMW